MRVTNGLFILFLSRAYKKWIFSFFSAKWCFCESKHPLRIHPSGSLHMSTVERWNIHQDNKTGVNVSYKALVNASARHISQLQRIKDIQQLECYRFQFYACVAYHQISQQSDSETSEFQHQVEMGTQLIEDMKKLVDWDITLKVVTIIEEIHSKLRQLGEEEGRLVWELEQEGSSVVGGPFYFTGNRVGTGVLYESVCPVLFNERGEKEREKTERQREEERERERQEIEREKKERRRERERERQRERAEREREKRDRKNQREREKRRERREEREREERKEREEREREREKEKDNREREREKDDRERDDREKEEREKEEREKEKQNRERKEREQRRERRDKDEDEETPTKTPTKTPTSSIDLGRFLIFTFGNTSVLINKDSRSIASPFSSGAKDIVCRGMLPEERKSTRATLDTYFTTQNCPHFISAGMFPMPKDVVLPYAEAHDIMVCSHCRSYISRSQKSMLKHIRVNHFSKINDDDSGYFTTEGYPYRVFVHQNYFYKV